MSIQKQFKKGLLQGAGFLTVLLFAGTVYAFSSPLSYVSTGDDLTAQKWNDIVDAVNDEYSMSESLTNKIWLGKPVYRKVIQLTSPSNTTGSNYDISGIFAGASECRVVDHLMHRTDGRNTTGTQTGGVETDVKADCSNAWIKSNASPYFNMPVDIVIEYVKN